MGLEDIFLSAFLSSKVREKEMRWEMWNLSAELRFRGGEKYSPKMSALKGLILI